MLDARSHRSCSLTALALVAIALAAFAVRSFGLEHVFTGPGEVILRSDDAQYHARRALYTFVNFPEILVRDPYLSHPRGAHVPWPPLYDFALAAAARAFGESPEVLDRVLAWASVALGSLAVFAVYALTRAVDSRGVAVGAAAIYALLAASVNYSGVGNPDHHAAVALEGAALVASYLWTLRGDVRGRRLAVAHAALVASRSALLLTWQGSPLYLAVGESAWLALTTLAGRRDSLALYSGGLVTSALLIAPALLATGGSGPPLLSGVELSWLHATALLALALVASAMAVLERAHPAARAVDRARRLAGATIVAGALCLSIGELRESVGEGFSFLGKKPAWVSRNYENISIFEGGATQLGRQLFGYLVFLMPVAPFAVLWRARERPVREPALALALWTAAFGALALGFARFANDFAPAGAAASAIALAELGRAIGRWPRWPRPFAAPFSVALGLILLWPCIASHARRAPRALDYLRGRTPQGAAYQQANFHRDLHQFAERVRAATPETAGFLDAGETPEYGILCFPAIGHVVTRAARRPTTASNFGPYAGKSVFRDTNRFYALTSEERALALARRLGVRYVITSQEGRPRKTMLLHRLHAADGAPTNGLPALQHFRLVTEWPARGIPLGWMSGTAPLVTEAPFKLFEIVAGAVLSVRAPPGSEVTAEIEIETATGRRFAYRAAVRVPDEGIARLRVPYASEGEAATRTLGPYVVVTDSRRHAVAVSEADVREGRVVRVE